MKTLNEQHRFAERQACRLIVISRSSLVHEAQPGLAAPAIAIADGPAESGTTVRGERREAAGQLAAHNFSIERMVENDCEVWFGDATDEAVAERSAA